MPQSLGNSRLRRICGRTAAASAVGPQTALFDALIPAQFPPTHFVPKPVLPERGVACKAPTLGAQHVGVSSKYSPRAIAFPFVVVWTLTSGHAVTFDVIALVFAIAMARHQHHTSQSQTRRLQIRASTWSRCAGTSGFGQRLLSITSQRHENNYHLLSKVKPQNSFIYEGLCQTSWTATSLVGSVASALGCHHLMPHLERAGDVHLRICRSPALLLMQLLAVMTRSS